MSNHEQEYIRPSEEDMISVPERPREIAEILRRLSALEKIQKEQQFATTPAEFYKKNPMKLVE